MWINASILWKDSHFVHSNDCLEAIIEERLESVWRGIHSQLFSEKPLTIFDLCHCAADTRFMLPGRGVKGRFCFAEMLLSRRWAVTSWSPVLFMNLTHDTTHSWACSLHTTRPKLSYKVSTVHLWISLNLKVDSLQVVFFGQPSSVSDVGLIDQTSFFEALGVACWVGSCGFALRPQLQC